MNAKTATNRAAREELAALNLQIIELEERRKTLNALIGAPHRGAKPKPKPHKNPRMPASKRAVQVVDLLRATPDAQVKAGNIAQRLGWAWSTSYKALQAADEAGTIHVHQRTAKSDLPSVVSYKPTTIRPGERKPNE